MRYRLELASAVRDYLDALTLTREGRLRIYVFLHITLPVFADEFRARVERASPDSPLFVHEHIFEDGGRLRALTLAVDDSTAAYGVLRVVYADCP